MPGSPFLFQQSGFGGFGNFNNPNLGGGGGLEIGGLAGVGPGGLIQNQAGNRTVGVAATFFLLRATSLTTPSCADLRRQSAPRDEH